MVSITIYCNGGPEKVFLGFSRFHLADEKKNARVAAFLERRMEINGRCAEVIRVDRRRSAAWSSRLITKTGFHVEASSEAELRAGYLSSMWVRVMTD